MNNLGNLYETDMAFRDIVTEAAARAIGTTNVEFAEEWLALPVGETANMDKEIAELRQKRDWSAWDEIALLERKLDELTDELEVARGKNKAYKLHIAKMQDGRNGWHLKADKMQKQVEELEARVEKMREQLGQAADLAGAILRTCMDCTDYEGGVVA
jgi:chromosome segregation ATPase